MCVHICLGTKNVAKQMLKMTQGRVRDREVTWFPELVDKDEYSILHVCAMYMCSILESVSMTHPYWTMKNCEESAEGYLQSSGTSYAPKFSEFSTRSHLQDKDECSCHGLGRCSVHTCICTCRCTFYSHFILHSTFVLGMRM